MLRKMEQSVDQNMTRTQEDVICAKSSKKT